MNYEKPWPIDYAPTDCYWYHTLDLPGLGMMEGDWDLRPCVKDYLGRQNWEGRSVLDIGTANGFVSFAMEAQGAVVTSFDQHPAIGFDLLPDWENRAGDSVLRMKRGYWLAHRALASNAKCVYGSPYDLPGGAKEYDYAILASILLHLENPICAVREACRVAERVIITEVHRANMNTPHMVFRPAFPDTRDDFIFWWYLPEETMIRMLQSFRMAIEECYHFTASGKACGDTEYYCIVARQD